MITKPNYFPLLQADDFRWKQNSLSHIFKKFSLRNHVWYEWMCTEVKEISLRNSPSIPAVNMKRYKFSLVYTPIWALTQSDMTCCCCTSVFIGWGMNLHASNQCSNVKTLISQNVCFESTLKKHISNISLLQMEIAEIFICFVCIYLPPYWQCDRSDLTQRMASSRVRCGTAAVPIV